MDRCGLFFRAAWAGVAVVACGAAAADTRMLCGSEVQVERNYCVRLIDLRQDGDGHRQAPLFVGARVVYPTNHVARADCRGRVLSLLDGKRVPYWTGAFNESVVSADLGPSMCESALPDPAGPRKR